MKCKTCQKELAPLDTAHLDGVFGSMLRAAAQKPRDCPECYAKTRRSNWIAECRAKWREIAPKSVQVQDDGRNPSLATSTASFPGSLAGRRNLFLVGPCRAGKTYSAWQCVLSAIIAGKSVKAINGERLSYALRDFSVNIESLIDGASEPDVLLIDEINKIDFREKGVAKLVFAIINARAEKQRITIYTANASLSSLKTILDSDAPTFSEPIISRISESLIEKVLK